jgi:DNA recombination protein RmuC
LSARIVDFQQKVQAARLEARQSEAARAIAEQAGQLYDALVAAVAELNEVSLKLRAAGEAHDDAVRKLTTGKGSAVSRAQQLRSLGGASTDSRVVPLKSAAETENDANVGGQKSA